MYPYVCMCLYLYMYMPEHVHVSVKAIKGAQDPLKLEWQAVVSHLMWVLCIKLCSSGKVMSIPNLQTFIYCSYYKNQHLSQVIFERIKTVCICYIFKQTSDLIFKVFSETKKYSFSNNTHFTSSLLNYYRKDKYKQKI